MRRFACSLIASIALMTAAGCAEETPPEGDPLFDGGSVGQNQNCPTCSVDGGLATAPNGTASSCTTLDPGVCAQYANCTPVLGLAYDPARYCRGETQLPVYCQANTVECGFGTVRVVDPVGQRWVLANKCLPPGYKAAPMEIHPIEWIEGYTVCPSASLATRCGQLDESGCNANPTCFAQMGSELDARRSCKASSEHFVACVQNTTCNRVLTYARDQLGQTWELSGSCLPSGFTALPNSAVASHTNWPSCLF
jgi:hypothetical protein